MKPSVVMLCLSLLLCIPSVGQERLDNVRFLADNQLSPNADLSAVSWLAGHWRGQAFGGMVEEVWSPPLGGSMMGAFKLVVEDTVQLYEIETISEVDDTLIFRLKHFNRDLSGWEEKDVSVEFALVEVTRNKVYFDGLTLERVDENNINIYIALQEQGKQVEHRFSYTKVKAL